MCTVTKFEIINGTTQDLNSLSEEFRGDEFKTDRRKTTELFLYCETIMQPQPDMQCYSFQKENTKVT